MPSFFLLYQSPSSSLNTVSDSISSNIDEVLSINLSAVFVFGTLTSIIRTGLPILVELIDPVNSVIIFLSQMTLLRWFTYFLTRIPNSPDYSHADWDDFGDHFRDDPWEAIFKLGVSAAASKFCEWVPVGIDVYIPHKKY